VVAVSGVLIFAGYQLVVYGLDQVRGGNNGFVDLLWPGRFKTVLPDGIVNTPGGLNDLGAGGTIGKKPSVGGFSNPPAPAGH
jgi:hypothetical protein